MKTKAVKETVFQPIWGRRLSDDEINRDFVTQLFSPKGWGTIYHKTFTFLEARGWKGPEPETDISKFCEKEWAYDFERNGVILYSPEGLSEDREAYAMYHAYRLHEELSHLIYTALGDAKQLTALRLAYTAGAARVEEIAYRRMTVGRGAPSKLNSKFTRFTIAVQDWKRHGGSGTPGFKDVAKFLPPWQGPGKEPKIKTLGNSWSEFARKYFPGTPHVEVRFKRTQNSAHVRKHQTKKGFRAGR